MRQVGLMIMFVSVLSRWITRRIHDPNSIVTSSGSVITFIGCGVDRGSIITGLSAAAKLADAVALTEKEASTVCNGADLRSGVVGRSVCVGGIGGSAGDNLYVCVSWGVDEG